LWFANHQKIANTRDGCSQIAAVALPHALQNLSGAILYNDLCVGAFAQGSPGAPRGAEFHQQGGV
jgi:hypothetical protein